MIDCSGVLEQVRNLAPLVHCITNPISIHDCADAVLAVGAKPIMAEHPQEVAEIVRTAQALSLNLGNITDVRMESMRIAAAEAHCCTVPIVLDAVGAACSQLRRAYASNLIMQYHPDVIKGNVSEIKALCGDVAHAQGIDAGQDTIKPEPLRRFALQTGAVVVVTGAVDQITDGVRTIWVENGTPRLARITGMGCVLGALIAAYRTASDALTAACLGTLVLGIAGEQADRSARGTGSFHMELLDALSNMTDAHVAAQQKIREQAE